MGILKNTAILALYGLIIWAVVGMALHLSDIPTEKTKVERYQEFVEAKNTFAELEDLFQDWKPEATKPASLDDFIGSKVALFGTGSASTRGRPLDLISEQGVNIRVITGEQINLPAQALFWEVKVTGEVQSIEWKSKTIFIRVQPGYYNIGYSK